MEEPTIVKLAKVVLEKRGYIVTKRLTPEEYEELDQKLADFEKSNRQFPDELFQPKSST
ncbi:hypothetical protein [Dyadobacter sp. CY312]|uniref:hypothetical protein n=1 Tax=Dyadobacter sp. CY312 TaxID=2907303 RepID=UPI001F338256|nr:hypothetical protein [Dyadobacter sp. CY312]MCE7039169.1 hypothetical protein [Dyadobacter sp. CY312]